MNGQPGYIVHEPYCGPITVLIGIFVFPFVCCCPLDRRQEFYALHGGAQPQLIMQPPAQVVMQQPQYAPQPAHGQPAHGQPSYGQPAYGQPAAPSTYSAPVAHAPGSK